jgi:CheY-like chemotaxis protein
MATILLIEDDDLFRPTLAWALRNAGYTVQEACNGRDAMEQFRAARPDVVVTDILMPEREGIETIRELRRLDPSVRVIAMSGSSKHSPLYLEAARLLGARRVLAKPFGHVAILGLISELLAAPESQPDKPAG